MAAYVYILRCADGRYYVGSARGSLEHRIAEHDAGTYDGFTKGRRPVTLVFAQEFDRIVDAIAAEQQLKGWSRAKKEALIRGDFDLLRVLARRGGSTPTGPARKRAPRASRRRCVAPQHED